MEEVASEQNAPGQLPARYESIERLGRGGGGEVWAVRDRSTGQRLALKVLAHGSGAAEVDALIRETVALSGLEGLGLPRVLSFGRLADGRPYLIRELVDGTSLEAALGAAPSGSPPFEALVEWLARAAEVLTELHRSGLLHGDIKPANIIVRAEGSVTLVDLGLAAVWQERGAIPEGLTPHYAAPEVMAGRLLTARSEVYSLGVVLREIIAACPAHGARRGELEAIVARATASEPAERYPSVDEFASALRSAAGLPPAAQGARDEHWPVEGIDRATAELLASIAELEPGALLRLDGPSGSGRTTLLKRVAWSLSTRGHSVVWLDEALCAVQGALDAELSQVPPPRCILVDLGEAAPIDQSALGELLMRELAEGARVVTSGGLSVPGLEATRRFDVPPLEMDAARRLLKRALPSLTDALVQRVLEATGARPGALREFVARAGSRAVASSTDVEELLAYDAGLAAAAPLDPLEAAHFYLDRGRFTQARSALDQIGTRGARETWLEARWQLGAGTAATALRLLDELQNAPLDSEHARSAVDPELLGQLEASRGRALLGVGRYDTALQVLAPAESWPVRPRVEGLAYRGLAQALLGRHAEAAATLSHALECAERDDLVRLTALVASSFATALLRAERLTEAADLFRKAIRAAESVGDAGILSSAQINLAALLKVRGELAPALDMLESAVDTARRSGRRATLHQALLNLANADLYLGRVERAASNLAAIDEDALTAVAKAQLSGLRAELTERTGRTAEAVVLYGACEEAWSSLGRKREAAEAALEGVLVGVRADTVERSLLQRRLERARELLADEPNHRALLRLAEARLLLAQGDERGAEERCAEALAAAEAGGQREWLWRSLELEAELCERMGRAQRARRARQRALEVVEDIGASLPRDLREVYWNDPRRGTLRALTAGEGGGLTPERLGALPFRAAAHPSAGLSSVSRLTQTPLEQRLARILAVNHDLAGEIDPERLCQKIVLHAAELLGADRAFLLLGDERELTVHAMMGAGADAQREFSSSIARKVVRTGEPLISIDASLDGRLENYASVHQRMVRSVACLPVFDPRGVVIGALHLETRGVPSPRFADELPTLSAFAEQAAIALENARLVAELRARTLELETTNRELAAARGRLEEVLEARTERLKAARRELRSTRQALEAHYTYEGLVGTSEPMRRIYAMIERVKGTDVPVLITGESGTGKEVVARAIHQSSPRSAAKFLGVNCGAIPEQILESELFGHVRGAFTGADRERKGLFREAQGGSLLLDEIGETPAKMQTGLLRVLQERRVRPVGGHTEEPVDVRVIFATNRDLEALVREGRFREDLLYRIRVVELRLPALRERTDDIPQLVDHFFARFATRFQRSKKALSREALHRLLEYSWPGNVRQLENVLLNAWVLSEGDVVEEEDIDLPETKRPVEQPVASAPPARPSQAPAERDGSVSRHTASQHRRDERRRIVEALKACNWNRVRAAELIGMPRRTFYRRLHEYGIQ